MMRDEDPRLTTARIASHKLLQRYTIHNPKDVLLEDLAMALGVVVIDGLLKGAEARLVRRGNKGLVRVREGIPESGRRRFAIAHELGHWQLHEDVSPLFSCTETDIYFYAGTHQELEANEFAAQLLMPNTFMREHFKATPTLALVRTAAAEMDTTLTATCVRIIETTRDSCFVVFSENGIVQWWRRSDACPRFWLEKRQSISQKSVASSIFDGKKPPSEPERVATEAWFEHIEHSNRLKVYEESMRLGRYPAVMTILSLY